ncbi:MULTISPECIES: PP2C family protein-serine/threonine phosphatase [unclassified Frankia]|uniref:PP2C family protein-serine/threonine phosphatase n=1 Tax=unclassified Frankia TaxID=2632575 RepID=UPI0019317967|nr:MULTISPECIES: GAF domain-containing SpoIIE family protein phosphatase [unclassified Frankia]MBL7619935.1 SpoIIE family protein phosphatase [Frankia sp. AgB1.8]
MSQDSDLRQLSAQAAQAGRRAAGTAEPADERVEQLSRANQRVQALLDAVLVVSRELELPVVLRQIVSTAMELVGARYGALGVLDAEGESLAEFIPIGLTEREYRDLAGVELPHGRGLLGRLIRSPGSLRVDDVHAHPDSVGFPPGHPPMRTMLGVGIGVSGRIYGNIYLCDRYDGRPFDQDDEAVVVALAGAAGVAVENARLFNQVRASAEQFQRLLLPRLPDLSPLSVAAVYKASSERGTRAGHVGGDWYDALLLPDGAVGAVIGDVVGHDLVAAAAMAQTRNMLRALLYDKGGPPSTVLAQLDRTLEAVDDSPIATACLARVEPADDTWRMTFSNAGHVPPLLLSPNGASRYLDGAPDVPLGVDARLPRRDHSLVLPPDATLILFTDGLVEDRCHSIDHGLDTLAALASGHAARPLPTLCQALADEHPSDGHDDLAVLAIRTPGTGRQPSPAARC